MHLRSERGRQATGTLIGIVASAVIERDLVPDGWVSTRPLFKVDPRRKAVVGFCSEFILHGVIEEWATLAVAPQTRAH